MTRSASSVSLGASAVPVVATDARNRRAIRRRQKFPDTTTLAEPDIRKAFHTPSHRMLDGRP